MGGQCFNCGVTGQLSKEPTNPAEGLCGKCHDFIYRRQNFREDPAKARALEERRQESGWHERRMAKKQVMYAAIHATHDNKQYFAYISESQRTLRLYDEGDICEVEVTIHPDQTPEERITGFGIDYWAWVGADEDDFSMVQPSWPSFSMQFAGGGYGEQKCGHGMTYRVQVREIRKLDNYAEQGEPE